jgi:hypothetical protein
MFTLAVHAAAPANFAGTWTLDKSKSQGLSERMQGAESVTWTITQTDKTITVEEKVTGGGQMAGGPPVARLLAVQVAAVGAAAAEWVVRAPSTWMAVRRLGIRAEANLPERQRCQVMVWNWSQRRRSRDRTVMRSPLPQLRSLRSQVMEKF